MAAQCGERLQREEKPRRLEEGHVGGDRRRKGVDLAFKQNKNKRKQKEMRREGEG